MQRSLTSAAAFAAARSARRAVPAMVGAVACSSRRLQPAFSGSLLQQRRWQASSGGGDSVPQPPTPEDARAAAMQMLAADVSNASAWQTLGLTLRSDERVEIPAAGTAPMSKLDCLVKAVTLELANPERWYCLGTSLAPGETAVVDAGDGTAVNQLQCYVLALELGIPEAFEAYAWHNLGACLRPGDAVDVAGAMHTAKDAFVRALQCPGSSGRTWSDLGLVLRAGESATVDGVEFDKKQCFAEAIRRGYNGDFNTWHNLGVSLALTEAVDVTPVAPAADGEEHAAVRVTRRDCFARSLRLGSPHPHTWFHLGVTLTDGESVDLGGQVLRDVTCFARAIERGWDDAVTWHNLAVSLDATETTPVSGVDVGRRDCLVRAVQTGRAAAQTWAALGTTLADGETVEVTVDGATQSVSRADCERIVDALNAAQQQRQAGQPQQQG